MIATAGMKEHEVQFHRVKAVVESGGRKGSMTRKRHTPRMSNSSRGLILSRSPARRDLGSDCRRMYARSIHHGSFSTRNNLGTRPPPSLCWSDSVRTSSVAEGVGGRMRYAMVDIVVAAAERIKA